MKKINKHFTDIQIKLIKEDYASIANKHNVSSSYVSKIARNVREADSETAAKILDSLRLKLEEYKSELA